MEKERSYLAHFKCLATLNDKKAATAFGIHTVVKTPQDSQLLVDHIRLHFPRVKIILVKRLNLVARLASARYTEMTGIYMSFTKKRIKDKIILRRKQIEESVINCLRSQSILEQLKDSHEVLDCIYEQDILPKDLKGIRRVFDFLQVDQVEIDWPLIKKIAPPPSIFIDQYTRQLKKAIPIVTAFDTDSGYKAQVLAYLEKETKVQSAWV